MSLRTFTVFQDASLSEAPQPKVTRPATRSSTRVLGVLSSSTTQGEGVSVDKENYHPVTGERAGPSTGENKKRKTVLVTKVQPAATTGKSKKVKESHSEPEAKKRKASSTTTITATKTKTKKDVKVAGANTKKPSTKRTVSKKVSALPKVNEEEEGDKECLTQAAIDSRCYDLTVKPLADVSDAYSSLDVFQDFAPSATANNVAQDDKVKFRIAKASSVEPEIRDYFQPSQARFCGANTNNVTSRFRSFSEGPSEGRFFSTPERKQIYAAFTFSSPSGSSGKPSSSQELGSGTISPAEAQ
ncbi:hypothetical protein D9613_011626 [Agrocybe pediades]|uniref:Uncharacterized protein n=1 Tax=Agrocybe pediades TaxID=84607 RepID=A0A8H4VQ54_9AGAR|nr:hypothetical protein D9613_011626 [Agrocybe pediades]